ncbi:MAG: flagellar hook assembly protein FlgD [Devosia sp.]
MSVTGINGTTAAVSGLGGSRASIAENFETFLTLLTTQLKNQNPLDPLDTNQFTSQLVQFTSVEQQLKTNEFLEAMVMSTTTGNNGQAVSYIGRTVTASGVRSELAGGSANWSFYAEKAADVTVTIRDASGNAVHTHRGNVAQGESVYRWDGMGSDGKARPDGTYSISIDARDADGKLVSVSTQMQGVVTGVDFSGTEPVLLIGNARVNLSSVSSVKATQTASGG